MKFSFLAPLRFDQAYCAIFIAMHIQLTTTTAKCHDTPSYLHRALVSRGCWLNSKHTQRCQLHPTHPCNDQ